MTYGDSTPSDLRTEDPRPAPSLDAEEAIVRELLATRLTGDDLHRALQALGLEDYERTLNPTGRDAWAKRVTDFHLGNDIECGRGHQRGVYGFIDNSGRRRCRECNRQYNVAKRERKKAAA